MNSYAGALPEKDTAANSNNPSLKSGAYDTRQRYTYLSYLEMVTNPLFVVAIIRRGLFCDDHIKM